MSSNDLILCPPKTAGVAIYPPGATFGPRRMRDYEFVWIIEGNCRYSRDDQTWATPAGAIVLCRPDATDAFTWDQKRQTRHAYFHFDITHLPADWPRPDAWPVVTQASAGDVLIALFQHVLTHQQGGDTELLHRVISTMLRAFITGQHATAEPVGEVPPDPVERAIGHIYRTFEADPAAELTLDDLADAACVTPEHLCRVFQKALDRSPMECVRLARLDRAAVLLSRSNFGVGQIARMCGFASQFHFARRFKEAFGQTPTALRQAIRDGATPPIPRLIRHAGRKSPDQFQA